MKISVKSRLLRLFILLLCASIFGATVIFQSISGPLAAQKSLAIRAAHDSAEAVKIAEEAMKLSGRAGVHKFPLYPIDQIYFFSLGDSVDWFDPESHMKEYEQKAAAWRKESDGWLVFFHYNKPLKLSGCAVQVLKTGGYRYKFDPDYCDYHFDHKI